MFLIVAFISLYFTRHFQAELMKSYENEQELIELTDSLIDRKAQMRDRQPSIPRMNKSEYQSLKARGLEDPGAELIDDLIEKEEIIPHEGRLGGTMGFYAPENIFILNGKWVFAYFEDGHQSGNMLLSYSIAEDGEIEWEVLDSYVGR